MDMNTNKTIGKTALNVIGDALTVGTKTNAKLNFIMSVGTKIIVPAISSIAGLFLAAQTAKQFKDNYKKVF